MSIEKMDATGKTVDGKKHTASLEHAVKFSSWPTPRREDSESTMAGTPAQNGNNAAGNNDYSRSVVALAPWVTPNTRDWRSESCSESCSEEFTQARWEHPRGKSLSAQAYIAGPARRTATGVMLTGSSAGMASGGQLNPALSRWLMGLPKAWDQCAPAPLKKLRGK